MQRKTVEIEMNNPSSGHITGCIRPTTNLARHQATYYKGRCGPDGRSNCSSPRSMVTTDGLRGGNDERAMQSITT